MTKSTIVKEGDHVLALYDGPLPVPEEAHEDEAFDPATTLLKARVRRLCRADPSTKVGTYELDYYTVSSTRGGGPDDATGDEEAEGMDRSTSQVITPERRGHAHRGTGFT